VISAVHFKAVDGKIEIRSRNSDSCLAQTFNYVATDAWPLENQTHFQFGNDVRFPIPQPPPRVHRGAVLSTPILFDDAVVTKRFLSHDQVRPYKPIGGEMELYQVAAAADEERIDTGCSQRP